jgi:hypothetical protein
MKANNTNKLETEKTTRNRSNNSIANKRVASKNEDSIEEQIDTTSSMSNLDKSLSEKLNEIDSKISAAELIQEFTERLNNINIIQTPETKNDNIPTSKINFFSSLFRSNSSNSSMRMIFFIWAIGTWVIWAGMSLYKNDLQPISSELAAVLAALGAAKMGQTFGENKFKKYNSEDE